MSDSLLNYFVKVRIIPVFIANICNFLKAVNIKAISVRAKPTLTIPHQSDTSSSAIGGLCCICDIKTTLVFPPHTRHRVLSSLSEGNECFKSNFKFELVDQDQRSVPILTHLYTAVQ